MTPYRICKNSLNPLWILPELFQRASEFNLSSVCLITWNCKSTFGKQQTRGANAHTTHIELYYMHKVFRFFIIIKPLFNAQLTMKGRLRADVFRWPACDLQ